MLFVLGQKHQAGIAGETVQMLTQLLHSGDREAEEISIDFGAHKSARGYKRLLEIESTMKTHVSEDADAFWVNLHPDEDTCSVRPVQIQNFGHLCIGE